MVTIETLERKMNKINSEIEHFRNIEGNEKKIKEFEDKIESMQEQVDICEEVVDEVDGRMGEVEKKQVAHEVAINKKVGVIAKNLAITDEKVNTIDMQVKEMQMKMEEDENEVEDEYEYDDTELKTDIESIKKDIEYVKDNKAEKEHKHVIDDIEGLPALLDDIKNKPTGPVSVGGYTKGVRSIVAGTNITIDETDPRHPIISATGGGGTGAVDSVNGQTGVVVLDADDIDDSTTAHKFVTATDITKLANTSGTNTGDQDLSGLVPYTGATTDLNLGVHMILAPTRRATTSAGVLIESTSGTDIGVLGVGDTANVEWYGSHNFSGATQDTIAIFTGTGKTLGSASTSTYPSLTELSYVKGVTSSIQTQLNAKQASDSDLTDLASKWAAASASGPASLQFHEDTDNGTNKITVQAPATLSADYTLTLPTDDGTSGQLLQTDGSGVTSWATIVRSIVAGTNITIDETDPRYPIINATGGGSGGAVDSVNGQTGVVVLDADDIDDTTTVNKFVTATDLTKLANTSGTNTGDQDLSGLVPYTGATGAVNLGTNGLTVGDINGGNFYLTSLANGLTIEGSASTGGRVDIYASGSDTNVSLYLDAQGTGTIKMQKTLETAILRAISSSGFNLHANNGTDIGLLGAGNTANVTWYGSHNYSAATQDTIAIFTGAGKTLGSASTATYPNLTEFSYLKGVTSAIQTQLNAKQASDSDLTDLASKWTAASASGPASLQFHEDTDNGTNKITVQAPATLSADYTLTLPTDDGTSGQLLQTDGSGVTSWATIAGGDTTNNIGYLNIPHNTQSAAYTLVLGDSGKCIDHPASDATGRTYTIPANSSVAYPIGTAITFSNMSVGNVTIAINTDTLYNSSGSTGSRTLAQYGTATAVKKTSTTWLITGTNLT